MCFYHKLITSCAKVRKSVSKGAQSPGVFLFHFDCGVQVSEIAHANCRAMMTKGMVFRYMWVYSKEDTMAHTHRPVVTSN